MTASHISNERLRERAAQVGILAQLDAMRASRGGEDDLAGLMALTIAADPGIGDLYRLPFPKLDGEEWGVGYVSDSSDRAYTLVSGLSQVQVLDAFWKKHRATRDHYRVLDFGCGTGRLLRFLCEFGAGIQPRGCEVNPKAVSWLQGRFPCLVNQIEHSFDLSFLPARMDLIYAWSIFTHFSQAEQRGWLAALSDALAPGGLLLATFKSTAQIQRLETDLDYRAKSLASETDVAALRQQAHEGFAFFECYDNKQSADHGIDAHTFGQAYISPDYVRREWARYGDVVEIGVAAEGWQDLVVLRKRAD